MKNIQKTPTDPISRDDYYRGTTLVADKIVYLSSLLTITLTVFPFIKTSSLLRKRCSRTVIHVCLCTGSHQPPALCYRETTTTIFPIIALIILLSYRSAYMQKIPTDSISRDDYYRGTTLVVDKYVYLSSLLTIISTVFSFIKTSAFTTKKMLQDCNSRLPLY